jgi:hypothetical protein
MDNPEWQHKKEKQNKNTTQYVLNTTIRKQTHKYHTYDICSPDIKSFLPPELLVHNYKCSGYVPCCVTVNTHAIVNRKNSVKCH